MPNQPPHRRHRRGSRGADADAAAASMSFGATPCATRSTGRRERARPTAPPPSSRSRGCRSGVDVTVRYALDPRRVAAVAPPARRTSGGDLIEPVIDGVLHRAFAQHTVREIFTDKRDGDPGRASQTELAPLLARTASLLRAVFLGNVDLPAQYRDGPGGDAGRGAGRREDALHAASSRRRSQGDRARAPRPTRSAARRPPRPPPARRSSPPRRKAEAMKHVLPSRRRRSSSGAWRPRPPRCSGIKQAEGEAEARRIEAAGEADARRKLADSDAYRIEVTGKATSEQMARDVGAHQPRTHCSSRRRWPTSCRTRSRSSSPRRRRAASSPAACWACSARPPRPASRGPADATPPQPTNDQRRRSNAMTRRRFSTLVALVVGGPGHPARRAPATPPPRRPPCGAATGSRCAGRAPGLPPGLRPPPRAPRLHPRRSRSASTPWTRPARPELPGRGASSCATRRAPSRWGSATRRALLRAAHRLAGRARSCWPPSAPWPTGWRGAPRAARRTPRTRRWRRTWTWRRATA